MEEDDGVKTGSSNTKIIFQNYFKKSSLIFSYQLISSAAFSKPRRGSTTQYLLSPPNKVL